MSNLDDENDDLVVSDLGDHSIVADAVSLKASQISAQRLACGPWVFTAVEVFVNPGGNDSLRVPIKLRELLLGLWRMLTLHLIGRGLSSLAPKGLSRGWP